MPNDTCQRNDNDSAGPIPLGFTFQIFGHQETDVYVNTNGNLTFGAPLSLETPVAFPAPGLPAMIAPFWADIDTRAAPSPTPLGLVAGSGTIWLNYVPTFQFGNRIVITWDHVGYNDQNSDKLNTFQAILTDGQDLLLPAVPGTNRRFNVALLYNDMNWTTGNSSGGVNGFGGTGALVGASVNGIGCTNPANCSTMFGPFTNGGSSLAGGGVDWLSWRAIYLDVSVSPPIVQVEAPTPDPEDVIIFSAVPNAGLITPFADVALLNPTAIIPLEKGTGPVFSIPSDPSLMGVSVYAQIAVVDPTVFPSDPVKMTPGMVIQLGLPSFPIYFNGGSEAEIFLSGAPTLGETFMLHCEIPGL